MVWEDSNVYLKQGILNLSQRVNLRRESVYFKLYGLWYGQIGRVVGCPFCTIRIYTPAISCYKFQYSWTWREQQRYACRTSNISLITRTAYITLMPKILKHILQYRYWYCNYIRTNNRRNILSYFTW